MRTSNPVLQADTFSKSWVFAKNEEAMTVQGVIVKTGLLLILMILSSAWTWNLFFKSGLNPSAVNPWIIGGAISGFAIALLTTFKQNLSPVTAPLYAAAQGLFLGGISATLEVAFPGIVIQAATLTFGTLAAMLFAYQSGLIRPTETFKAIVVASTGGIFCAYLISFVLNLFHVQVSLISGNSFFSIAFSLFVVAIAAFNLVIDFDFIEKGVRHRAAKHMEWYGAFALMVTLIWLYIELIRLLSKLRSR